ncbi:hypothetical protein JW824_02125 [bacterium]|nr:hypothetical protein [bacterium]
MDNLRHQIEDLVKRILDAEGFRLVDLVIKGKSPLRVLQFFVDREGGLTIADCVYLNRKISDLLAMECEGLDYGSYRLEVSSPGIDRALRTSSDFERNIDRIISVSFQSEKGTEHIEGKILEVKNGSVYLQQVEGESLCIPIASIVNAKIRVKW